MFLRLILVIFVTFIAGCATRPIPNDEAIHIPESRILDSKYLKPTPNSGTVTVKRDSGFFGSACSYRIFIDAKPIADIQISEKVVAYLPAGEYIFSAWPNGICGGGLSEVRAMVKSGAELNFRIGYGSSGDFTINATAF